MERNERNLHTDILISGEHAQSFIARKAVRPVTQHTDGQFKVASLADQTTTDTPFGKLNIDFGTVEDPYGDVSREVIVDFTETQIRGKKIRRASVNPEGRAVMNITGGVELVVYTNADNEQFDRNRRSVE